MLQRADTPRLAGCHPRMWITSAYLLQRPEVKHCFASLFADKLLIT